MSATQTTKLVNVTKLLLNCKGWDRMSEVRIIVINSFGITTEEMNRVIKLAKAA